MNHGSKLAATVAISGTAGWALENAFAKIQNGKPRFSKAFGGASVPFLPIYAAGGAGVLLAAPHLQDQSMLVRFAAYATGLTALEYAGCMLDRSLKGNPSWDYPGCIDLPHFLMWGMLGLAVEAIVKK